MKKNIVVHLMIMGLIITSSNIVQSAEESRHDKSSQCDKKNATELIAADTIAETIARIWFVGDPTVSRNDFIEYYRNSPTIEYTFDILNSAYEILQKLKQQALDQARTAFKQQINNAQNNKKDVVRFAPHPESPLGKAIIRYLDALAKFHY
jgi:hypothetical protein